MFIFILLTGHFIADFILQTSNLADLKTAHLKYSIIHSIMYAAVFAVISYMCLTWKYATGAFLVIAITHCIIDCIRRKIDYKLHKGKHKFISFLLDQALHVGVICSVYCILNLNSHFNNLYNQFKIHTQFSEIVLYAFLFILLMNPASVLVKKFLYALFEYNLSHNSNEKNQNIGSTIGILERIITAVFILCNQYEAIGLVLTAKSIARFKQLEEKDFAEKYLIGTLTSLLISLVATLIIKSML